MSIEKSTEFGSWILHDILEGRYFRVPDYQRGYAWSNRQLEEFWEDLCAISEKSGGRHYTGAITVEELPDSSKFQSRKGFEVVDGQQRLTTVAILLSVLKNDDSPFVVEENGGKQFVFSYGENNEDRSFLERLLAGEEAGDATNSHQRNLKFAKQFFQLKADEMDADTKDTVGEAVMRQLAFDFRVLGDDFDAGVVFETMNNRGKPLTILEKLKNRLIYLVSYIVDNDDAAACASDDSDSVDDEAIDLRKAIVETWGEIYQMLGRNPERVPLDEDEFLAAHLSLYRNPKESTYSPAVAESRLFKMFCVSPERYPLSESVDESETTIGAKKKREGAICIGKIKKYVEDLRGFAPFWVAIHDEYESSCGRCRLLSGTREIKVFLASVERMVRDENLRGKIYQAAENILFRNTIRSVIDEGTLTMLGRRLYGTCLDQLRGGDASPLDGNTMLATLNDALTAEKRKIDAETLVRYFSDRMDRQQAPYGFYGWSGLKYFLFTQEGSNGFPWSRFEDASLEHIIPQSATEDGYNKWWKRQIQDFVPEVATWNTLSTEEKKMCRLRKRKLVNTLGNFVLLSHAENSSVSDSPWERYPTVTDSHEAVVGKRTFYQERVDNNGAHAVSEMCDCWNAFRVRERGRSLFRQIAIMLGVEGLSADDIDIALGFSEDANLGDTQFAPLTEPEVARLAPNPVPEAGQAPARPCRLRHVNITYTHLHAALSRMSEHLKLPMDMHNSEIALWRVPAGMLILRFTKNNPHAVWNFWVSDKETFSAQYGNDLMRLGAQLHLEVRLGRDHGYGNGVQFRPGPIDLSNVNCNFLEGIGDQIREGLGHILNQQQ